MPQLCHYNKLLSFLLKVLILYILQKIITTKRAPIFSFQIKSNQDNFNGHPWTNLTLQHIYKICTHCKGGGQLVLSIYTVNSFMHK